jgi:serine/threonine protein phosphatase PrpC
MADSTAAATTKAAPPVRKGLFREVFGLTDVGLVREGNEDALLMLEDQSLYVVADGMGGHACGEVASAFTIEAIKAFYLSDDITRRVKAAHRRATKGRKDGEPEAEDPTGRDSSYHALRLRKAVESANISVYRLAQQHEQLRDMGTTVVATAFVGSRVYVANVGDSRVYRMRKGKLEQLTEDHSLLNEYIKMNLLQPDEIENFPYKNVIVRALGLQESVGVDIFTYSIRAGDQILLCSDGLTDLVRDEEIRRVMADAPSAEAACHKLTDFAKDRGGHDNITTLIIRMHDRPAEPRRPRMPAPGGMGPGSIPPPPSGPAPMDALPAT